MRYLITLVLSVLVIAAAFHFAKPLPKSNFDESFLPKANSVRYIAAGNNSTVAGLFWIKGLTELGESFLTGREYAYLGHVANLSTELDSLFYTPYYFVGGVTALDAKDTSDFVVLRRANKVYPDKWRLSLYYAMRLAKGPYPDKKAAADIMRPYFDSPDTTIPVHIRTIYRTFELDTMQLEMAVRTILEDVLQPRYKKFRESFSNKMYRVLGYHESEDAALKERVLKQIKQMMEMVAEGKMHPQYAYNIFISMKYEAPAKETAEAKSADSTNVAGTSESADTLDTAGKKETTANP